MQRAHSLPMGQIFVQMNSRKKKYSFLFADTAFAFHIFHEKIRLVADHCFIYALVNKETDSIFFVGRFIQPSDYANMDIRSTVSNIDISHNEVVTSAPKIFEIDQTPVDSIVPNNRPYEKDPNPNRVPPKNQFPTNRTPPHENPSFTSETQIPIIYSSSGNFHHSHHPHNRHYFYLRHSTSLLTAVHDRKSARFGPIFPLKSNPCHCVIRKYFQRFADISRAIFHFDRNN